jgi:hypothetical protein
MSDDIPGDAVWPTRDPYYYSTNEDGASLCSAKNKDTRIACAGRFDRGMRITDRTRSKKCAVLLHRITMTEMACRLQTDRYEGLVGGRGRTVVVSPSTLGDTGNDDDDAFGGSQEEGPEEEVGDLTRD